MSHLIWCLLILQVLILIKQIDLYQVDWESCGKSVNWVSEVTYFDYYHTDYKRKVESSKSPYCRMSSEEQTALVQNLQLDDSSNNIDDEEVVSKYFSPKENIKPKCDSGTDNNEDEKDTTSTRESEENSTIKESEKSTRIGEESIEPKKIMLEKEEQVAKTEEKNDDFKDFQKQFDSGNEKLTGAEKEHEHSLNLQNEETAQKNDSAATSDEERLVEYTSDDFGSRKSESDMNGELDMKSDSGDDMNHVDLNNLQNESEETIQMAVSEDGTESSQETPNRNKLQKRFSDRDTENYRNGYPGMEDDQELNDNVKFYRGEIESSPEGEKNDDFQKQFDSGNEKLTGAEKELEDDLNLQNEETAQKNDSAATSDEERLVEYTSDDFGSPKSESDMNGESYMKSDSGDDMNHVDLSNLQNESEETVQMAVSEDSTESSQETSNRKKLRKRFSDRDTENYRNGYPGMEDDQELNENLKFYRGEIESSPDGALIDDIHRDWMGKYKLLEVHHGYIQWLFPIREHGMNWQAQPLQLHEAEAIKADPTAKKRVLESYKLMLDFYGMKLVDEETGVYERSENWKECFHNLNWSSHNYLRITRILKCLGELGYEHLKKGFIQFVLVEALEHRTLTRTLTSCKNYWIGTIKNAEDREELYNYIDSHEGKSGCRSQ